MDQRAKAKIGQRLLACERSVIQLQKFQRYSDFRIAWVAFLTEAKGIYTTLERGAQGNAASEAWFAARHRALRDDQLLKYVYEARNDEEHGLEPSTEFVPGRIEVGVSEPGYSGGVMINSQPDGSIRFDSLDGKPILTRAKNAAVALRPVTDRKGRTVPPPREHLGVPMAEVTPLRVAAAALDYLRTLVEEARALP